MSHAINRIISADSHVMEPTDLWEKALFKRFGEQTPRTVSGYEGRPGKFFYTGGQMLQLKDSDLSAQKIGFQEAGYKPEVRVEFQKQAHVECELLHATLGMLIMQGRRLNVVRACAQVFNDWLADFCAYDPSRLLGIAMLPMDDPEWACAELQRIRKKGLRGAMIHLITPRGSAPLRDPIFDQFWATAQDLEIPITLHIVTGRVPDPLHSFTAKEQSRAAGTFVDILYEIMGVLANEFIFGGILDRFPKLKLVCSEFEISWIPNFMWRLDQIQDSLSERLKMNSLTMKASDYMKTRIWHGMIDDPLGAEAIRHIGVDRVMWGSDFPHIRSIGLDAESRLTGLFESLTSEGRDKIVCNNVAGVYRL